jgi:hypothetical protein
MLSLFQDTLRAEQRIREKHSAAVALLEHKLKKIPTRAFFTGRKPTIQDIYDESPSLKNPQYPPECQIGAVFRNWDKVVAARFAARKHD